MNVSMQDTYNLGWKLALVVQGVAKPSILKTYESERRAFAQALIAFDRRLSALYSGRPAKDANDEKGISLGDFEEFFVKQKLFAAGFAVDYEANILNAKFRKVISTTSSQEMNSKVIKDGVLVHGKQQLASNIPLGQRFPSFKVVNHSGARSWHFGSLLKSDGRFHMVIFAGDVSQSQQMKRVHDLAHKINSPDSILRRCRKDIHALVGILTIHCAPRDEVELCHFPEVLHPFDEETGWDYDKIFVDTKPYYEEHGQAYQNYGVDPKRGCVVIARPDQYVSWIGDLEDDEDLQNYFKNIFIVEKDALLKERLRPRDFS